MSDKSSNVPYSIVYSAIGAESLKIARASNNPESFSTAKYIYIYPIFILCILILSRDMHGSINLVGYREREASQIPGNNKFCAKHLVESLQELQN